MNLFLWLLIFMGGFLMGRVDMVEPERVEAIVLASYEEGRMSIILEVIE